MISTRTLLATLLLLAAACVKPAPKLDLVAAVQSRNAALSSCLRSAGCSANYCACLKELCRGVGSCVSEYKSAWTRQYSLESILKNYTPLSESASGQNASLRLKLKPDHQRNEGVSYPEELTLSFEKVGERWTLLDE